MHHLQRHPYADTGFTLVEVLIALALMAILFASLASSLSFGRRAWETAGRLDKASNFEIVPQVLRDCIGQAVQPDANPNDSKPNAAMFEGQEDRIVFIANLPGRTELAGLHRIEIFQERDKDKQGKEARLMIRQTLFRDGQDAARRSKATDDKVLADGIAGLRFRYFGAHRGETTPEWRSNWIDQRNLPDLISMTVTLAPDSKSTWPEMIFDTKLGR